MTMCSTSTHRALLVAVTVVAAACVRPVAMRSSIAIPGITPVAGMTPTELELDAALNLEGCTSTGGESEGFARMKVRDSYEVGAPSELEYELAIENKERRLLAEVVLVLSGVGSAGDLVMPLWSGEVSSKPRLRMRGIVALPRGVSTTEVAAALRERRGALQVRVADQAGAVAGCGDLRN
jgi:hypothetical protein